MKIIIVTNQWPDVAHPERVPFLVQRVKFLRKAGVEVRVFSFSGRKNPINYLRAWMRIRKMHKKEKFDLIAAHFGPSALTVLPTSVPLVTTFHGSDLQGVVGKRGSYLFISKISQLICRYVARRSDRVIVVARCIADYLPADISYDVILNGVNFEVFYPLDKDESRKKINWPLDKRFVLFAAKPFVPVKRFSLAKEAIAIVQKKLDIEMKIVYDVRHDQMPLYFNAADVLLVTSKHEGSPNIVREAVACGLPVVSVDIGDVRQQIGGIKECFICENDSPQIIAEALIKAVNSGQRIQPVDRDYQSEEKMVEKIIAIYKKVIK
jgi:glycosyltransferase involved in cell wall biosynthesis